MRSISNLKSRTILFAALMASTALVSMAPMPAYAVDLVVDDTQTIDATLTLGSGDEVIVGSTVGSNGTLTIESGGALSNGGDARIGDNGTGTVTVTGTGTWINTNGRDHIVGQSGTGTLNIENGGTVEGAFGVIAFASSSTGVATVTGPGSSWTMSEAFTIGRFGNGTLTIADGGEVSNFDGFIGSGSSSTGTVTVTGTGSTWTNTSDLTVGDEGTGTLNVENGGSVSNTSGVIGALAGSFGTVTVTGAGSTWTNSTDLTVGDIGTGTLNVTNGGFVDSSNSFSVGRSADGVGTVTISGGGSKLVNDFATFIGEDGTGTLTISDGGELDGSDSVFFGFEVGSEGTGTVTGSGSKLSGGIIVGRAGVGTLTVSDGGLVEAEGNLDIANSATGTGTLNIGAATNDGAAAAGTINAATIAFGPGTGTLNFNHTGTNYTLASDITGSGTLNHLAGVTNLTGDASGFTGTTNITGGTLRVNNALGGDLNISGGAIGGSGTLGNLTVASGGTIAPGNSIGTLNVTNITLAAGSTYEVEVNSAGQSDLINATGTATINGGAVKVLAFPDFALGTAYTIVTAGGGVTGTFDSASYGSGSIFITPTLSYDANNAFVSLAQTASFAEVAETPNQIAAAGGADSLAAGNAVKNAIFALGSVTEARTAFDAISGEIHASAQTALIEDSRFPREATFNRLRFALGGAGTADQAGTAMTDSFAVWGQGFGSWGDWNSDGNAAAMDRALGGVLLGGDALVRDTFRLGLMGGYSQSSLRADGRASSAAVDSYTLGAYAGSAWDAFSLKGGLAQTWHRIDTARSVGFTGFSDGLSASYNARTFQAHTEAAYSIDRGRTRFEPYANLAYVNLDTDGFTETGGAAALTSAGQGSDAIFTTLGIRGETEVALGEKTATLSGGFGWRHAFGDTPAATHNLAGGTAFTVAGVPLGRDALVLDAGFAVNLTGSARFGLSYNGQLGSGISDHGGKASFNVRF